MPWGGDEWQWDARSTEGRRATNGVVELPDDWSREETLPLKGFADAWFDTLEDARAELTRRLDGLSGKTG